MPSVDVVDETFLAVPPAVVAAEFAGEAAWRRWWPDLHLAVDTDRGERGVRWTVTGALVGSMEVWLEPYADGVVVHHYVRCDPAGGGPVSARERRRRQRHAKAVFWALKDELEGDRRVGEPRAT